MQSSVARFSACKASVKKTVLVYFGSLVQMLARSDFKKSGPQFCICIFYCTVGRCTHIYIFAAVGWRLERSCEGKAILTVTLLQWASVQVSEKHKKLGNPVTETAVTVCARKQAETQERGREREKILPCFSCEGCRISNVQYGSIWGI